MIPSPVVTELNASTYTAIELDVTVAGKVNNVFNPSAIYTEDGSAFYIATDSSGTDEALIPVSKVYNSASVKVDPATGIVCYAKAVGGTPNLVVLLGLESASRNK